MTKESVKILREFCQNNNTRYSLFMDNAKLIPSTSPSSLLVYDDANSIVYSFRPTQNPMDPAQRVNVLASEYDHIQFFDCDMTYDDAKSKMQTLVSKGILKADEMKTFLDAVYENWHAHKLYAKVSHESMQV